MASTGLPPTWRSRKSGAGGPTSLPLPHLPLRWACPGQALPAGEEPIAGTGWAGPASLLGTVRFHLSLPPLSPTFLEDKHHIPFTPCPLQSLPGASAIRMLRARWVNAGRREECAAFCVCVGGGWGVVAGL